MEKRGESYSQVCVAGMKQVDWRVLAIYINWVILIKYLHRLKLYPCFYITKCIETSKNGILKELWTKLGKLVMATVVNTNGDRSLHWPIRACCKAVSSKCRCLIGRIPQLQVEVERNDRLWEVIQSWRVT